MIGRRTIALTRRNPGRYEGPVFIKGEVINLTIRGSVQPLSGREIEALPEGYRINGSYAIRTSSKIFTGDILSIHGEPHEVLKVQPWQNGLINHYVASCSIVPFNNGTYTTGGMVLTTADGNTYTIEEPGNG